MNIQVSHQHKKQQHKSHQNKSFHRKQKQKQRKQIFRKWHRRLGFTVSLIIFNLAITGILLNHYESLSLHKNYISNELLLDWYDIKAPQQINCFKLTTNKICQLDKYLYGIQQNAKLLKEDSKSLVNVIELNNSIFVISSTQVYIYDQSFTLLEQIEIQEEFLTSVKSAAIQQNQLLLQTDTQWLMFDENDYMFVPLDNDEPNAVADFNTVKTNQYQLDDENLSSTLKQHYREKQITYLKLLQDLHSGQILARSGKLLTDITGIALLLLAISGFITWQRRKKDQSN